MNMQRGRSSFVAATMAMLLAGGATAAWSHGFGRGPFGRRGPGGPHGPEFGGLVQRLIFPCKADCFEAGRPCVEAAESDAVACGEETCDTEIQSARTACATDPAADACGTARSALLTCLVPCLDAAQSTHSACRTTLQSCLDACDTAAGQ
jgi:hypothetical protein